MHPSEAAFKSAAAGADWENTFYQILNNKPGAESWPITTTTYILMHAKQDTPAKATAALKFFDWAYTNGDKTATDLDYVSLPQSVKDMIRKEWTDDIKDASGNAVSWK